MNPFDYMKPSEELLPKLQETRNAFKALHEHLLTLPQSRELSVALTNLETTAMWAIKAQVHNDPGTTQPEA